MVTVETELSMLSSTDSSADRIQLSFYHKLKIQENFNLGTFTSCGYSLKLFHFERIWLGLMCFLRFCNWMVKITVKMKCKIWSFL